MSPAASSSPSNSSLSVNSSDGEGSYVLVEGHPGYFFNSSAATSMISDREKCVPAIQENYGMPRTNDECFDVDEVTEVAQEVLDDGLETQGFIYEKPMDDYWLEKNRLNKLGSCSEER
jgi:hypothetical protein